MLQSLRKRRENPVPSPKSSELDPFSSPLPPSDPGSTVDGTYNDEEERRGPLPKTPRKNRDPNKKISLTEQEKARVVKGSAYGKRCGVTWESFKGNADNEFFHVAEKCTPIELVHHLEGQWGMPHGTLNVDRSENVGIMQANLHKAFDSFAFMFFPDQDVVNRVEEYTALAQPKAPFDAVFKLKRREFWAYNFVPLKWNKDRSIFIKNIDLSRKSDTEDGFHNAPGYTQFDPFDTTQDSPRVFRFHINPLFMIFNAGYKMSKLKMSLSELAELRVFTKDNRATRILGIYNRWMQDYRGPPPKQTDDDDDNGELDRDNDDEDSDSGSDSESPRSTGDHDKDESPGGADPYELLSANDQGKLPQGGAEVSADYDFLVPAGQGGEVAPSGHQEDGSSTIAGGPPASTFVGTTLSDDSDSRASGSQWDDVFAPSVASAPAGVPGPSFALSGNIDKRLRGHPKAPKTNIQNASPVPQAIRGLKRKPQSDAASEPQASTRGRPHRGAPKTFSLPPSDEPGQSSSQSAMPPPSIPSRRHSIRLRSSVTQASASSSTIHNEGGPPQSVAASQSMTSAPAAKSPDDEDSRHSLRGPKRKKKKRNSSAEYKPGHS